MAVSCDYRLMRSATIRSRLYLENSAWRWRIARIDQSTPDAFFPLCLDLTS
jgi:hypothetical protein